MGRRWITLRGFAACTKWRCKWRAGASRWRLGFEDCASWRKPCDERSQSPTFASVSKVEPKVNERWIDWIVGAKNDANLWADYVNLPYEEAWIDCSDSAICLIGGNTVNPEIDICANELIIREIVRVPEATATSVRARGFRFVFVVIVRSRNEATP